MGVDYQTKWINNMNTFKNSFGIPKTEAERYFYNGAKEVLQRGGTLYCTKLPYDNESYGKFTYTSYKLIYEEPTEINENDELSDLLSVDEGNTITSYMSLSNLNSGTITIQELDDMLTDNKIKLHGEKQLMIVNMSRDKYKKDYRDNEMVGIVPVVTTAANALYAQGFIRNDFETKDRVYNTIGHFETRDVDEDYGKKMSGLNGDSDLSDIAGFTQNFGSENLSSLFEGEQTLSRTAIDFFPQFKFKNHNIDNENLKKIGIVVFKMFIDEGNEDRIGFIPVESFTGSLIRNDVDEVGKSVFIDRIVNENSKYIRCFSNITDESNYISNSSTFYIHNQNITSLGFYEKECEKTISLRVSIKDALNKIFDRLKDPNYINIDVVMDAGVSNIAQYIKDRWSDELKGMYDILSDEGVRSFTLDGRTDVIEWYNVIQKYDDFCKNVRKDCMFIADGLRPLCLKGNSKLVRFSDPSATIEKTVLTKIKYMSGLINSSYGAGYCDWHMVADDTTQQYFWCPPSIKASGIYLYTDIYSDYWMAPAGLNRGRFSQDVVDVAFSPTQEQAGVIYNNNWNYAINYPLDGIIQEGQRTFQKNKTALDRVNVRRLMLGLEKNVKFVAKYFTYEGITDYLMMRFKDSITPILDEVQQKGGIREYYIVCDGRNNNTNTIDNNELHCTIAVKPVKSLEFLVLNFVATNQSANVQEVAEGNL